MEISAAQLIFKQLDGKTWSEAVAGLDLGEPSWRIHIPRRFRFAVARDQRAGPIRIMVVTLLETRSQQMEEMDRFGVGCRAIDLSQLVEAQPRLIGTPPCQITS